MANAEGGKAVEGGGGNEHTLSSPPVSSFHICVPSANPSTAFSSPTATLSRQPHSHHKHRREEEGATDTQKKNDSKEPGVCRAALTNQRGMEKFSQQHTLRV